MPAASETQQIELSKDAFPQLLKAILMRLPKFKLNLLLEKIWPQTNPIKHNRKKKKKWGVVREKNFHMDKLPKLTLCEILSASAGRGTPSEEAGERQDTNIHCLGNTWESVVLENKDKQENLNMSVPCFVLMAYASLLGAPKGKYSFPLNSSERVD